MSLLLRSFPTKLLIFYEHLKTTTLFPSERKSRFLTPSRCYLLSVLYVADCMAYFLNVLPTLYVSRSHYLISWFLFCVLSQLLQSLLRNMDKYFIELSPLLVLRSLYFFRGAVSLNHLKILVKNNLISTVLLLSCPSSIWHFCYLYRLTSQGS